MSSNLNEKLTDTEMQNLWCPLIADMVGGLKGVYHYKKTGQNFGVGALHREDIDMDEVIAFAKSDVFLNILEKTKGVFEKTRREREEQAREDEKELQEKLVIVNKEKERLKGMTSEQRTEELSRMKVGDLRELRESLIGRRLAQRHGEPSSSGMKKFDLLVDILTREGFDESA